MSILFILAVWWQNWPQYFVLPPLKRSFWTGLTAWSGQLACGRSDAMQALSLGLKTLCRFCFRCWDSSHNCRVCEPRLSSRRTTEHMEHSRAISGEANLEQQVSSQPSSWPQHLGKPSQDPQSAGCGSDKNAQPNNNLVNAYCFKLLSFGMICNVKNTSQLPSPTLEFYQSFNFLSMDNDISLFLCISLIFSLVCFIYLFAILNSYFVDSLVSYCCIIFSLLVL